MLSIRSTSLLLFTGIAIAITCGCGEQKKPDPISPNKDVPGVSETQKPAPSKTPEKASEETASKQAPEKSAPKTVPSLTETGPKPVKSDGATVPSKVETPPKMEPVAKAPAEQKSVKPQQKTSKPFRDGEFVSEGVVGLVVAHPKQFMSSPVGQMLSEFGVGPGGEKFTEFTFGQLKIQAVEVERVTYVLDQITIDKGAREIGLTVDGDGPDKPPAVPVEVGKNQLRNNFKQLGLAFHNYHDTYRRFPRADGNANGDQTGLSWRVHLLPFIDQAPLYNEFHLDEPWDCDHNKTLIAQMPDLFRSPGVEDGEKTSFHVFTGENTPFHGEQGLWIPNFTDGTSNTILAVLAGADTAEIWTKPGGLEVDLTAPKKSLGELKDKEFLVLIADGSVRYLPTEIDDTTLANLIQPADGNVVNIDGPGQGPGNFVPGQPPAIEFPSLIISLVNDAKQEEILTTFFADATEETHEGQTFRKSKTSAVWFPDSKTVIVGSIESVKHMISAKQSGRASNSPLIEQLQLEADYTSAVDIESQSDLIAQGMQMNPMMGGAMGMVLAIKTVSIEASASAKEGNPILLVTLVANDNAMAAQISAMLNMFLEMGKGQLTQIPPARNDAEQEIQDFAIKLANSAELTQEGDTLRFIVPTPADFDTLPKILRPILETVREAAKESQKMNNFKQIGLAMHNFHDVFQAFPGSGRMHADKPVGLSWRVYLLPYVDQAPLYNQFKLDEPWDSDHNKQFIEKMPDVYKTPGVQEAGKTSIHVFTGAGAAFADDHTPKMFEFTDGLSNTFLVVQAGADKADVWTKPGGLDFDPENPLTALGKIAETFMALFADGSVRMMSKDIEPEMLRRYILHNDGLPVN